MSINTWTCIYSFVSFNKLYVVNGHIKSVYERYCQSLKVALIVAILNIPSADKNEHSRMDGKINHFMLEF